MDFKNIFVDSIDREAKCLIEFGNMLTPLVYL